MHIVILGATGSGKTTLARSLASELGIQLISSGAIARDLSMRDTATDLALKQGALAPEHAMRTAIRHELEKADATHNSWVLDGFPRSVEQLVCLTQWTRAMPVYLNMNCKTWTLIERLAERGRYDDNPDAVGRKLQSYLEDTIPAIEILREAGVLVDIPELSVDNTLAYVKDFLS